LTTYITDFLKQRRDFFKHSKPWMSEIDPCGSCPSAVFFLASGKSSTTFGSAAGPCGNTQIPALPDQLDQNCQLPVAHVTHTHQTEFKGIVQFEIDI